MTTYWNNDEEWEVSSQVTAASPRVRIPGVEPGTAMAVPPGVVEFTGTTTGRSVRVELMPRQDPASIATRSITLTASDDESISRRMVQQVNVGWYVAEAIVELGIPIDSSGRRRNDLKVKVNMNDVDHASTSVMARRRGRPRTITENELRLAADVYRSAAQDGRPRGAAVAAALNISSGTARKRISAAREVGLLPPTGGTTRPRL